ncbi:MAG: SsrA-binding protein SmpB [Candidatus Latescibacterota bacterium]|nr:MAG: SsrA-binding protein SmpB [Candidatus Latescibacterota bacterium]
MEIKTVCTNRKARHEYKILDTVEAGLVLTGSEVKSLRAGHASLQESHARIEDGEVFLVDANIRPYERAGHFNHEPTRRRKLLLSESEIRKLTRSVEAKGATLIPLRLYFKGSWAKVEIGVAIGKRAYDKRAAIAERDAARELDRARQEARHR